MGARHTWEVRENSPVRRIPVSEEVVFVLLHQLFHALRKLADLRVAFCKEGSRSVGHLDAGSKFCFNRCLVWCGGVCGGGAGVLVNT